jgi:hypothetical protein
MPRIWVISACRLAMGLIAGCHGDAMHGDDAVTE